MLDCFTLTPNACSQLDGTFLILSVSYIPLKATFPTSNYRTTGAYTLPFPCILSFGNMPSL